MYKIFGIDFTQIFFLLTLCFTSFIVVDSHGTFHLGLTTGLCPNTLSLQSVDPVEHILSTTLANLSTCAHFLFFYLVHLLYVTATLQTQSGPIEKLQRLQTDLWVVGRLLYDFRCHPERSSNEGVPFDLGVCQLARHSEVRQLHVALFRQQHIGR